MEVAMSRKPRVLVLGGGPDSEREVSIKSSTAIAEALKSTGVCEVELKIIEKLNDAELAWSGADVIFPYLHGAYGEGGPLQDALEQYFASTGVPFVGSGASASRLCMDKVATKAMAVALQVATPPYCILNTSDVVCPLPLPVIVKPVHEGSTVGLHVCMTEQDYVRAIGTIEAERKAGVFRSYVVEPKIGGQSWARELTVGVVDGQALPIVEIAPKDGLYDYAAKYTRDDTRYIVNPELPTGVAEKIKADAVKLFKALRCRHIARVDFMLDIGTGGAGSTSGARAWMLEINTTPGMTDHSLVPKAAAAQGMSMPQLCLGLVQLALRDSKKAQA
jgi:D-alanine-D-alanine ligase